MTDDPTTQRRGQLGSLVRRARETGRMSVDLAAERAGMSPVTWGRVEKGEPVRGLTYAGIELTLGWARGSIDDFLRGGAEPRSAGANESPQNVRATKSLDALAEEIKEVLDDPAIPDADRFAIAEMLMEEWDREDAQTRQQRRARARAAIEMWKRAKGTA